MSGLENAQVAAALAQISGRGDLGEKDNLDQPRS
jgi:hypothetical protein